MSDALSLGSLESKWNIQIGKKTAEDLFPD